jgi:cytochrome P450
MVWSQKRSSIENKLVLTYTTVDSFIGAVNIVTTDGPHWKYLHKLRFPAFTIQHISDRRHAVSGSTVLVYFHKLRFARSPKRL